MKLRAIVVLSVVLAAAGSILATVLEQKAVAARNSSGTYSLPAGNPVVTGTTISSSWANNTLNDLSTEMTNSLDRNGRGAMAAPLQLSNGTVSVPGLTFASETTSGLFRSALNDVRMSVASNYVEKWTATGVTIPIGLTVTQSQSNTPGVTSTGNGTASGVTATGGSSNGAGVTGTGGGTTGVGGTFTGAANGIGLVANGGATSGDGINATGGASGRGGYFVGGGTSVGVQAVGQPDIWASSSGIKIGATGQTITSSYAGAFNITFGALTVGDCINSTQTLAGVVTGGVCVVSTDSDIHPATTDCYVSGSNTIKIRACTPAAVTLGAGSYRVRVFQP